MKRSMEIEAKYRLKTGQTKILKEALGEAKLDGRQTDRYFKLPGKVLRIRKEGDRLILTQKGETTISPEGVKSRFEEEEDLTPREAALLARLLPWCGHEEEATVVKRRTTYRKGKVLFCLDGIEGLGDFLEIEGEKENEVKEAIAWLEATIGLEKSQIELSSYGKLIADKK